MPRMMRAIVDDAVDSQPDMHLLGHYADADLDVAIRRHEANVVILSEHTTAVGHFPTRLVCAHPELKVVVITGDGGGANLIELRHLYLADPSPIAVIGAIRAALERDSP